MRRWSFLQGNNKHGSIPWFQVGNVGGDGRTSKVEKNTESHDTQPVGGSEVTMGGSHIFIFAGLMVENFDVGRDISVSPFLGVVIEHLVGDLADVELVIAFVWFRPGSRFCNF